MELVMLRIEEVHSRQRKFLKLKDPEVKIHVVGLKNSKEARVTGLEWAKETSQRKHGYSRGDGTFGRF